MGDLYTESFTAQVSPSLLPMQNDFALDLLTESTWVGKGRGVTEGYQLQIQRPEQELQSYKDSYICVRDGLGKQTI
jgi:hypothetical protein